MKKKKKRDQRKERKFKRPKKDWSARPYTSREGNRDWREVVRWVTFPWNFANRLTVSLALNTKKPEILGRPWRTVSILEDILFQRKLSLARFCFFEKKLDFVDVRYQCLIIFSLFDICVSLLRPIFYLFYNLSVFTFIKGRIIISVITVHRKDLSY